MRIAIIGMGSIGSRHIDNLIAMGHAELMGYDITVNPREDRLQVVGSISDLTKFKPEIVLVCTPPQHHFLYAFTAMDSWGSHVFIEKPIATREVDARSLVVLAIDKELQLAVGYQLRWQLTVFRHRAQDMNLEFTYAGDMATWPSRYEKDALEECSHEIDAAVWINGPAKYVKANCLEAGVWRIKLEHMVHLSAITLHTNASMRGRYASAHRPSTNDATHWEFNKNVNDATYSTELAAFVMSCSEGRHWDDRLCSGAEAAHVVQIIEACRESAKKCSVVKL